MWNSKKGKSTSQRRMNYMRRRRLWARTGAFVLFCLCALLWLKSWAKRLRIECKKTKMTKTWVKKVWTMCAAAFWVLKPPRVSYTGRPCIKKGVGASNLHFSVAAALLHRFVFRELCATFRIFEKGEKQAIGENTCFLLWVFALSRKRENRPLRNNCVFWHCRSFRISLQKAMLGFLAPRCDGEALRSGRPAAR